MMESFSGARPGIKLCGITRYKWAGLTFVDIGCLWPWRVTCHDIMGSGDTEKWNVLRVRHAPESNKWHQQLMQLTFCCPPDCNSRSFEAPLKILREKCLGSRRLHEKIFRAMAVITHWQIAVSEIQSGLFKSESVSISERAGWGAQIIL